MGLAVAVTWASFAGIGGAAAAAAAAIVNWNQIERDWKEEYNYLELGFADVTVFRGGFMDWFTEDAALTLFDNIFLTSDCDLSGFVNTRYPGHNKYSTLRMHELGHAIWFYQNNRSYLRYLVAGAQSRIEEARSETTPGSSGFERAATEYGDNYRKYR